MSQAEKRVPVLAVSSGEPAGIGPDVLLTAYTARDRFALPPFFVLGDPAQLSKRTRALGLDIAIKPCDVADACHVFDEALPVVTLRNPLSEAPGNPDSSNAPGVIEAIEHGVALCESGMACGLVTAPIAKSVLYKSGFNHPGHTEFLATLAEQYTGQKQKPVMMIAGPDLRTVPVTIHIPLVDVPKTLSSDEIVETVRVVDRDMRDRFGLANPRIAIAGLNPHAGENGTIGTEDDTIITPAIQSLKAEGLNVSGPLPADTMFHAQARLRYDVAVCMYHDQALIPAKALAFDKAVNVTLGLPFIRTSPDHGTAFDIAGTGKARADSFVAAVKMAQTMAHAS